MMPVETLTAGIKLMGALILIVGGLLALNVYVRRLRTASGRLGARRMRLLETLPVGVKKQVALVQIPGGMLVLGLAPDRISLLDRITTGPDSPLTVPDEPSVPVSFRDQLQQLTARFQRRGPHGRLATPE
jgi:flagellar biogenesis protein FliO